MGSFLAELRRRHIFRIGGLYVVVAWGITQVIDVLSQIYALPDWIAQPIVAVLAIGFPVMLLFAWTIIGAAKSAHTPAELKKATATDWALITAVVAVLLFMGYQQFASNGEITSVAANAVPAGEISIAVLPFANMSAAPEQEYFSDGMTEEITTALAKIPDLRVVGRTSAFQFKGQNEDLRAIGEALGANYLMEGSVRKEGDQLRITAQLIQASDGSHVWAENYDRELTSVFAIQEEIASAIAGALHVPLGLGQNEALVSNRTTDEEVYNDYLRARAFVRMRAIAEAIELLESAVMRDPNFAPGWSLLAIAYGLSGYTIDSGASLEDALQLAEINRGNAEMAAQRAVQLDPNSATGFIALAEIQRGPTSWKSSEDLYRQALAIDPNEPDALHFYSMWLSAAGRLSDALVIRERLRTVEPFVPIYNVDTAKMIMLNGQQEASIPLFEAVPLEGIVGARRNIELARAYADLGRYDLAADTILAIPPNQNLANRQSVEDAAQLLRNAPAGFGQRGDLPDIEGNLSYVYAYIGAPERILELLEPSVQGRDMGPHPFMSLWHPMLSPLRQSERFRALIRDAGIHDYWRESSFADLCRPLGEDDFECD